MDRQKLSQLWNDQIGEGNWVPSWTDTLSGVTLTQALWRPQPNAHCLWQEVIHVNFWRRVTQDTLSGRPRPTDEEVEAREFALPQPADESAWQETLEEMRSLHADLADALKNEATDLERFPYHILHDAYHLGRVTQLLAMQGIAPKF